MRVPMLPHQTRLALLLGLGVAASAMVPRAGSPSGKSRTSENPAAVQAGSSSSSSSTCPSLNPVTAPGTSSSSSSTSSTGPAAKPDPRPISGFVPWTGGMPGFHSKAERPMSSLLEDKDSPAHRHLSLSRPAAEGTRCLLGTDTPGAKSHWLACMDSSNLFGQAAMLGRLAFSEKDGEVRLVEWIHPELAIVSTGEGALHLVSLSPSNQLAIHGKLPAIHKATLRELAINPINKAQFAAGGYDRGLTLVDLERPEAFRRLEQTGVIGSVAWPEYNQGVCPSLTLDDGTLLIYDTRVGGAIPPAFKATLGKKDLFAHTRYNDNNLLVGFGDGEIQHIDNRVTDRVLHRFNDPYCLAVGHLEYHAARNLLLVTGVPDLTVWRVDMDTATASPVCHFGPGAAPLYGDGQMNATFTESGDVLAAGSTGTLSRITLFEPEATGM